MFWNLITRFREREGRDWQALLLSLLLAFTIWFIYNMSAEYSAFLEYDVAVRSEIKGHANVATSPAKLVLRAKASGFSILKNRISDSYVTVNVSPSLWETDSGDPETFILSEDALKEILPTITGDKIRLEYFVTGMLSYVFPAETYKKVPVVSNFRITCRSQYMLVDDVSITPDSVLVYGSREDLSRISSVSTESLIFRGLKSDKDGVVSLNEVPGLRLSDPSVRYSVKVSRYVEMVKTVALSSVNVPEGKSLIMLPSKVSVVYRVPFPYRGGETEFSVGMDYEYFLKYDSSVSVPLTVFSVPEDVISYTLYPSVVDVIVRE